MVVGTYSYQCFSDTANILLRVPPFPVVDAGPEAILLEGESYPLRPVMGPAVTSWKWTPNHFLSCTDCPAPVARPSEPILYTLTVSDANGCTSEDTVSITLLCSDSRIYIPNAFTPDNNGRTHRFAISGQGIRDVQYLRIYNPRGNLMIESSYFSLNDRKGSRDAL